MKITVAIMTFQVPFANVIDEIVTFDGDNAEQEALNFINEKSKKWYDDCDGDRDNEIKEYYKYSELTKDDLINNIYFELWGGENSFRACIDSLSWQQIHENYYKRKFDDQGKQRPGYLLNAYEAEGEITDEQKEYKEKELEKIKLHYGETAGNA